MNNRKLGHTGEQIAENFLISQDYQIIQKNFYSRFGEIDIIACSPEGQLIFIEVKTRTNTFFGLPQESITFQKKQRIIKTALHFLKLATTKQPTTWRFDAILVQLGQENHLKSLTHLKNIIDG